MKDKIAAFFGKFQPPHLGHIITIKRILKDFNKIIVVITNDHKNESLDPKQIKKIFKEIFYDNKHILFKVISGSIEEGTASITNLQFDVAVSGNNKIISILGEMGYKTLFQPRSIGPGFSSSEIRSFNIKSSKENSQRNTQFNLELIEVSKLKPLEKVLPNHLKNIENMILKDGLMLKPIIIDNKFNIVLDGSHRYAFLLKLGYKKAPVIKVDYDDETVFVGNNLKHRYLIDKDLELSKSKIIETALNEKLLNPRTTRHFFPFRKVNFPVRLEKLIPGKKRKIDFLIEKTNIDKEINKNVEYINEIDEELDILSSYVNEQKDIKTYLSYQVNIMKKIKKLK